MRESNGVAGMSCADIDSAINPATPLVSVTLIDDGTSRVTALMPDGVSDVTLETANGTQRLNVDRNVASALAPDASLSGLSWQMPDGSQGRLPLQAIS